MYDLSYSLKCVLKKIEFSKKFSARSDLEARETRVRNVFIKFSLVGQIGVKTESIPNFQDTS